MKVKKLEKKRNQIRPIPFLFIGMLLGSCTASPMLQAIPAAAEPQELYPVLVHQGPKIDGKLDDETWQFEPLTRDFSSYSPICGEKLPYQTLVWMAYDTKNLYFAFKCYDPEPQKIKTSITRRDNMYRDDWIGLSLDAQGNKHTSYHLFINPNGIQGDALNSSIFAEDRAPDYVWQSAGKVVEKGYQVEIAIPLKSISYFSGKEVKMGILFWRYISRLGMSGSWPEIKPGEWVFNSHAIVVYKNLDKPLKLELLPAITHGTNRERDTLEQWGEIDKFTNLGIGLKYGITSSITAEITVKPDFSQVESDAFQVEVNQRYPLFYSEKRPFFMEGSDMFTFFTMPQGFLPNPVHTRRIIDPNWGIKITGGIGKTSLGILAAADQWSPVQGKQAFFGIARAKYNLGEDNYIGILYNSHELTGDYNRVFGADMCYRLYNYHRVNASFLFSMSDKNHLQEQEQEPNIDTRAQINSSDLNFMYFYQTRDLGIAAGVEHIGRDFRMDSSFLKRTGIDHALIWAGYFFYPDNKKLPWLKLILPEITIHYTHDLRTQMDDWSFDLILNGNFTRRGSLGINYFPARESWQGQTFNLDKFALWGGIQLTKWLQLTAEINLGDKIDYDAQPSYKGKGSDGFITLVLQPTYNLNQQFNLIHSDLSKDKRKIYDLDILYSRTTYQFNKYFFLRAILQYDSYQKCLLTDFLASFTLIPGTVFHIGYGGLYEGRKWQEGQWVYRQGNLLNIKRSFFLKASYLWRF